MIPVAWGERQQKGVVRAFQLTVEGPKKHMLMFPGWDLAAGTGAECIHGALSGDLIDRRTRLLCVEREVALIGPILQQLEELGLASRTRLHADDLHYLVLAPHERFDFAYFDFLGGVTQKTAYWIADVFAPSLIDGADVSLTVSYHHRNNRFYEVCREAFRTTYREQAESVRPALGITDEQTFVHALILATLFREFRFHFHQPYLYQDAQVPMLGFKLTGLVRSDRENPWPTVRAVAEAGQALRYRPAIRRAKDFVPGVRRLAMLRRLEASIAGLLQPGMLRDHPEAAALSAAGDAVSRLLARAPKRTA